MARQEDRVEARELRGREASELGALLGAKVAELQRLRFQQGTGQLRETHQLRELRKDVARIRLVLGEMTVQASSEGRA